MVMIKHVKRVESPDVPRPALLPVYPPEVNAVFFIRLMENIKVCVPEIVAAALKLNILFGLGVYSDSLCHFLVHILIKMNTVSRMQIERYMKVVLFKSF